VAANRGGLEILQKVWEWANEKLTTEEINNKLLLATDKRERAVLYMARACMRHGILKKLSEWAN
jgi:hypothetical protein